jgi:hypothetical protein
MRTLLTAGFVEKARVKFPVLVQIQELVVLVGFGGLDDHITEIKASVIESKLKLVRSKCEEIARFINARLPRAGWNGNWIATVRPGPSATSSSAIRRARRKCHGTASNPRR